MAKPNPKKGFWVRIIVLAIIIIAAAIILSLREGSKDSDSGINQNSETSQIDEDNSQGPKEYIVEITNEGFTPRFLEIKKGDTVTWKNTLVTKSRPAGDFHPTHTLYPGSSIAKCGTSSEPTIFDACKSLEQGETYSFTFNEVGKWSYHDHLTPSKDGRITVS